MKYIALFLGLAATSVASAEKVGNGGVAVVCRDGQGKISSAETLDLFEGRNQFGLRYIDSNLAAETLTALAQIKMVGNNSFLTQFRSTLSEVRAAIVFLPRGVGLSPTDDAFPAITKKGCALEQLANFVDTDSKIYVDEEIFRSLSPVDQAALFMHETVYRVARVNQKDTSSVRSRKLTAQLLASNANQGVIDTIMGQFMYVAPPPATVPYPNLQHGNYGTRAQYCGVKVSRSSDGTNLYLTFIDNPGTGIPCIAAGTTQKYTIGWVTFSESAVYGYVKKCSDGVTWCELVEIVGDQDIVRWFAHANKNNVTYFKY